MTGQDKGSFVIPGACTSSQPLREWSAAGQGKPSANSGYSWDIFDIFTPTHIEILNITASKPCCCWGRSINSLLLMSVTKHSAGSRGGDDGSHTFYHGNVSANRQQSAKCSLDRDVRRKERDVPWQEHGQTRRFQSVKWEHWVKERLPGLGKGVRRRFSSRMNINNK